MNTIKGVPEKLINKVIREHRVGNDFVQPRRITFKDRLSMYNNQLKSRDMVGIMNIYTTIQVLLSVYYNDSVTVEFAGRHYKQDEINSNLEKLSAFDHKEMRLAVIDYFTQWDTLFYGVGIRLFTDFDKIRKVPSVRSISPLQWVPDPQGSPESGFKFHGFEMLADKDLLTKDKGYNESEVAGLKPSKASDELRSTISAYQKAQGVSPQTVSEDNTVAIYHHYTGFDDGKYMITTADNNRRILRVVKLEGMNKDETNNPEMIPFPVILSYFSPSRYSPFGTSVSDLVEDKQRISSVLANLAIQKQKAALYPGGVYNSRKIKNKRDLDFGLNKYIGVALNPGESLGDVVRNHEKDYNDNGTFNIKDLLDSEIRLSTGADVMQAGVLSTKMRTLGEVQNVQSNANLRYQLHSHIASWGEEDFWRYWYREYKLNFSSADKKLIRVALPTGYVHAEFVKKDIVGQEDPDIIIRSKLEAEMERQKKLMTHLQAMPMILENPAIPQSAKLETQRTALRLSGRNKEEIDMLIPPTPDELDAENENKILAMDKVVEIEDTDDHMSHITIHRRNENTNQTQRHIEAHIQMYIMSGEREKMQAQYAEFAKNNSMMANQSQNQINNQVNQTDSSARNINANSTM